MAALLARAEAAGRLNPDQVLAVRAMLEMQDYTLVLGMPGTGKTSTIVQVNAWTCSQGMQGGSSTVSAAPRWACAHHRRD